jgi:hypothetical protein
MPGMLCWPLDVALLPAGCWPQVTLANASIEIRMAARSNIKVSLADGPVQSY